MSEDVHVAFQARECDDFLGQQQPGIEINGYIEEMFMSQNDQHDGR